MEHVAALALTVLTVFLGALIGYAAGSFWWCAGSTVLISGVLGITLQRLKDWKP